MCSASLPPVTCAARYWQQHRPPLTGEAGRCLLDPLLAEQITSADERTIDLLADLGCLIPDRVLLLSRIANRGSCGAALAGRA
jgi:hypothetical protein